MIVFILPEKRSYRKLYRRWFDSSIDVLTDGYDLKSQTKISSTTLAAEGKHCRQSRCQEKWHL